MKVIIITPSGRRRYLKILLKNLYKQKEDFYDKKKVKIRR